MIIPIQKDPRKGTTSSNYPPIICLSKKQKLFSGIIAAKLNRHVSKYMSKAQKGIAKNKTGSKLLINRAITQD